MHGVEISGAAVLYLHTYVQLLLETLGFGGAYMYLLE